MQVGDLVRVRRMSGLMTPLFGVIVEIKKDENNIMPVIVKPFSGPIQPANHKDVKVLSESQ